MNQTSMRIMQYRYRDKEVPKEIIDEYNRQTIIFAFLIITVLISGNRLMLG